MIICKMSTQRQYKKKNLLVDFSGVTFFFLWQEVLPCIKISKKR